MRPIPLILNVGLLLGLRLRAVLLGLRLWVVMLSVLVRVRLRLLGCSSYSSGTVSKLTAYIAAYGSGGFARAAIYSDLNGQPNLPVGGATVQVSVSTSPGWVDFVYCTPVSLQPGYYWLTLIDSAGCNWYYSAGGVSAWKWISYSSEPSSPFGSHTDRTDLISIYATYTVDSQSPSSLSLQVALNQYKKQV